MSLSPLELDSRPANIIVIDDTPENLRLLVRGLGGAGCRVRAAISGEVGLRMAHAELPDLVLLDINMPGMDGFEVCRLMQEDPYLMWVPILFISATHDVEPKLRALSAGGRDFVTKPFSMHEVIARVRTHVRLGRFESMLSGLSARLEEKVAAQVQEIADSQDATILALAKLAESRDDDTGMHVERMAEMSRVLARPLVRSRRGVDIGKLGDAAYVEALGRAATLHDIGKVGIPDNVLLKPGRLTAAEFTVMKTHTTIGASTIDAVLQRYPRNAMAGLGEAIANSHHEKWDGTGYPRGLAGEAIPFSARVVAVADVYDALRSRRPYKEPFSRTEAATIIREGRGRHFDPAIVDAFEQLEGQLNDIWCDMTEERCTRVHNKLDSRGGLDA